MTLSDLADDLRKMAEFMGWPWEGRSTPGYRSHYGQWVPAKEETAEEVARERWRDYRASLRPKVNREEPYHKYVHQTLKEEFGVGGKVSRVEVRRRVRQTVDARQDVYHCGRGRIIMFAGYYNTFKLWLSQRGLRPSTPGFLFVGDDSDVDRIGGYEPGADVHLVCPAGHFGKLRAAFARLYGADRVHEADKVDVATLLGLPAPLCKTVLFRNIFRKPG